MSISRNTAFNAVGVMLSLVISLITIPIYLKVIGESRYGVLAITWLLLGYFGFFDLGLGRATARRIGSLKSGTTDQRAIAFWTASSVNLGLGIIAGLIIWPVAHYVFGRAVSLDAGLRSEILAAIPWLALSMPFATLSGVLSGALAGREKFIELSIISVVGTAMFQTLPLVAVILWGPDLRVIMPVVLLSRALTLFALFSRSLHHVCPGHRIVFDKTEAIQLLKFGGWVTVSSISGPMMVILDRIIIGIISGAAAVTIYTVPFQLAERTTMLARALSGALFPRLSGLDDCERSIMAEEGQRALVAIMTPLSAVAILLLEPFLSIWISIEFSQSAAMVGIILVAGYWINCFAVIPYALVLARERPDLIAKLHLAELLPYFLMLYVGLITLGLPGAAIAFSTRSAFDAILLSCIAGQFWRLIAGLITPTLTICAVVLVATTVEPISGVWFSLSAAILSFAVFRAWKTLPDSVKIKLKSRAGSLTRKKGSMRRT